MRRLLNVLLVALIATVSCAGNHKPTAQITQTDRRVEVLQRDLAWAHDTIPLLRFNPPFSYGSIRMAVEFCSGKTRDGWPKMYLAPVHPLPGANGETYAGYYAYQSQSIIFALGSETQQHIVAHELLHWLLEKHIPPGHPEETQDEKALRHHPPEYFGRGVGRCGALVNPPQQSGSYGPAKEFGGIRSLLFSGGPPAVAGLVVPIVVDPVEARAGRARPHVFKKGGEAFSPSRRHSDTSAAVAIKTLGVRVLASVLGHRPRPILGRESATVPRSRGAAVLPGESGLRDEAPTTHRVPTPQVHCAHLTFPAARTAAEPRSVITGLIGSATQNAQASKLATRQVHKFSHARKINRETGKQCGRLVRPAS